MTSPPIKNVQNDHMLIRGNARSCVPILSGIRKLANTPTSSGERAVHRDELDVVLREDHTAWGHGLRKHSAARHGLAREAELPPHLHRQQSPDQQEEEADEQELDPDDLVVGREDVLPDEASIVVMRVCAVRRRGNARHCEASWAACFIQAS